MGDMVGMLVVLLVGVALAGLGAVLLVSQHTLRRRLRSMPRSRARHVRPGELVKMVGRLTSPSPMLAPLASVDCLYYRLSVLEHSNEEWREVSSERMYAEDWVLEDESGRIGLVPEEGVLESIRLREYDPSSISSVEDVRRDVVMRYVPRQDRLLERPVRLREERLDQGATVVVFGRITEGPRGLVLAGGHELEVYGQTEQQLVAPKPLDFVSWGMLLGGVGLLVVGFLSRESKPDVQAGEAVPIERTATVTPPPVPLPSKPRPPSASSHASPSPPPHAPLPYSPNRLRGH